MSHNREIDDLCPAPEFLPELATQPLSPPIYASAVYRCQSPQQADRLLSGTDVGYVYSRDGHPNADLLASKCCRLHAAARGCVTGSGMSSLALAALAGLSGGDHVVVSDQLYGKTLTFFTQELQRLGIDASTVDVTNLAATEEAFGPRTRLVVVETISNPLVRVCDLAALAEISHRQHARLLVDNTFASPAVCRPLEFGADLVMESLTKIMSGHSDVLLGFLGGTSESWDRVPTALSTWGLSAGPFDCWLALRGLGTMALRVERASQNALEAARFLLGRPEISAVHYPGLPAHPDHELAVRQFGAIFGSMMSFSLAGGQNAADQFIAAARRIPFCPSLGDISTTLSHPSSTSHRGFTEAKRRELGIQAGTIRLSVGIESPQAVMSALEEGLGGLQ